MERKIGEKFTINDKTYIVVEENEEEPCVGCAFDDTRNCHIYDELLGSCYLLNRKDKKNVCFKEIVEQDV